MEKLWLLQGLNDGKRETFEILSCNEKAAQYGLSLTEEQAMQLTLSRSEALRRSGRVELAGGMLKKLIETFQESPYLQAQPDRYPQKLEKLLDAFYAFKTETFDLVSDDELLLFMKSRFDGFARGSVEILLTEYLEPYAYAVRSGTPYEEQDFSLGDVDYGEEPAYDWEDLGSYKKGDWRGY